MMDSKIFVLGVPKAGTSIIAFLLSELVGLTVSIDLSEKTHESLSHYKAYNKKIPFSFLIEENKDISTQEFFGE